MAALGFTNYWDGYFAGRSAPLGRVPAEVVDAAFYSLPTVRWPGTSRASGTRPLPRRLTLRASRAAWPRCARSSATSSRRWARPCRRAARRGRDQRADRGPRHVRRAALAPHARGAGGPALARGQHAPRAPRRRPHRALVSEQIGGTEAHVLCALDAGITRRSRSAGSTTCPRRLAEVMDGLRDRGLLDADGRFTDAGRATKDRIESLTDALAEAPYDALTPVELDELVATLEPISARLRAVGSKLGVRALTPAAFAAYSDGMRTLVVGLVAAGLLIAGCSDSPDASPESAPGPSPTHSGTDAATRRPRTSRSSCRCCGTRRSTPRAGSTPCPEDTGWRRGPWTTRRAPPTRRPTSSWTTASAMPRRAWSRWSSHSTCCPTPWRRSPAPICSSRSAVTRSACWTRASGSSSGSVGRRSGQRSWTCPPPGSGWGAPPRTGTRSASRPTPARSSGTTPPASTPTSPATTWSRGSASKRTRSRSTCRTATWSRTSTSSTSGSRSRARATTRRTSRCGPTATSRSTTRTTRSATRRRRSRRPTSD